MTMALVSSPVTPKGRGLHTHCDWLQVKGRYKMLQVQNCSGATFCIPVWLINYQQPAGAQCIQGYERMVYTKGRQCAICYCKYPTFFYLTKCPIQSDGRRQNIQVIRSHFTETPATFKNLYTFQAYFLGVPWFHVRHAFLYNICWKESERMQNFGPLREKMPGESFHAHAHTVGRCWQSICVSMHCDLFRSHFLQTIRWHVSSMCAILRLKMTSVLYGPFLKSVFCMAHFWNLLGIWYTSGNQTSLADLPFSTARTNTFMVPFHPLPVGTAFCLNLTLPQSCIVALLNGSISAPLCNYIPQPYSLTFPRSAWLSTSRPSQLQQKPLLCRRAHFANKILVGFRDFTGVL